MEKTNSNASHAFWLRWSAAFFLSTLIVALATLPPFMPDGFRAAVMQAFAPLCHQIPARSPHLGDIALAVCHRCYGVYLGLPLAALGMLFFRYLPVRKKRLQMLLFGALGLLTIDWGLPLVGIGHNTPFTRMATGLLFGAVAGVYLVRALIWPDREEGSPPEEA